MRLALAILALSTASASAQTPVMNAWNSPCALITQGATTRGVVVLRTSARSTPWDYERVVRDTSFCWPRQYTQPVWVTTRDNPQCFAGYTCTEHQRGGRE